MDNAGESDRRQGGEARDREAARGGEEAAGTGTEAGGGRPGRGQGQGPKNHCFGGIFFRCAGAIAGAAALPARCVWEGARARACGAGERVLDSRARTGGVCVCVRLLSRTDGRCLCVGD